MKFISIRIENCNSFLVQLSLEIECINLCIMSSSCYLFQMNFVVKFRNRIWESYISFICFFIYFSLHFFVEKRHLKRSWMFAIIWQYVFHWHQHINYSIWTMKYMQNRLHNWSQWICIVSTKYVYERPPTKQLHLINISDENDNKQKK